MIRKIASMLLAVTAFVAGAEEISLVDSMSIAYARLSALMVLQQQKQEGLNVDKKQFLEGMNDVLKLGADKESYREGLALAAGYFQQLRKLQKESVPLNQEAFKAAFEKEFLNPTNTDQYKLQVTVRQLMDDAAEEVLINSPEGQANLAAGKAYMAENAKRPGVKVTESGLQYEILVEGEGECPKESDKVKVNYVGTLVDGTKFDSSYDRGKPSEIMVRRVIKGWVEALQMMKPGAKWRLVIPQELAYGPKGHGKAIGPCSTLIFEVELIEVDVRKPVSNIDKAKAAATAKK